MEKTECIINNNEKCNPHTNSIYTYIEVSVCNISDHIACTHLACILAGPLFRYTYTNMSTQCPYTDTYMYTITPHQHTHTWGYCLFLICLPHLCHAIIYSNSSYIRHSIPCKQRAHGLHTSPTVTRGYSPSGSSGLGADSRAWMDSSTVRICRAGDHLSWSLQLHNTCTMSESIIIHTHNIPNIIAFKSKDYVNISRTSITECNKYTIT